MARCASTSPHRGEIVVRGAKLSGSAVWRERGAYLQHGSILLRDSQHLLQAAMRPAPGSDALGTPPAASLATCLPATPTWATVASALERALRERVTDRHPANGDVSPDHAAMPDAGLVARHKERFLDPTWLWRR